MTQIAYYFILIVFIVILLWSLLKRNKQYWKKLKVFCPEPHAFFGNYKDVIMRRITHFEYHEEVYKAYPKEKVVGLYRFNTPVLLLRDLDIIQHVFIRDFDNFVNRGFELGERYCTNLASCNDDTWRMLRTRLSPIFTASKLKNMVYLIERCGEKLLEQLDLEISSTMDYDVQNITKDFAIRSISACAFGIDMDKVDDQLSEIEKKIFKNYQLLELFYICPGLLRILGINVVPSEIANYFCNLVNLIKEQRNGKPSSRKDFMDLLLEMKNLTELKGYQKKNHALKMLQITDDLIAGQAMIFYAAGFESTTNTLSYVLHELAKHPNIQEKLFREIKQTLEENNGELSFNILKQMKYMDQVFHETLRMYPPIDLQRKVSTSFCQIPGLNITLKRDDLMMVSVRGIHYDEKYYPEPHKFDPERFSPDNMKRLSHPCVYIPFGVGPRQCIGSQFSKVQNKIFLAQFLALYKVEPAAATKKLRFDPMMQTLIPIGGLPLKIIRRNETEGKN